MNIEIDDAIYDRLLRAARGTDPGEYLASTLSNNLPPDSPAISAGKEFKGFSEWTDTIDKLVTGQDRYYFRGEPSFYPLLRPKLQRRFGDLKPIHGCDERFDLQMSILGRMQRYTAQYHYDSTVVGKIVNFWEWLCIAQHHGYPTMLLDWTLNPYVSMFFSTDDPSGKYDDHHGRIWIMKLKKRAQRMNNTVHVGEENINDSIVPKNLFDLDKRTSDALESLGINTTTTYHRIIAGQPLVVVPRILTRRIDAQSGRFIYWPLYDDIETVYKNGSNGLPWEELYYYTVTPEDKKNIKRRLSAARIHSGTMYADLDGYARYISSGGL